MTLNDTKVACSTDIKQGLKSKQHVPWHTKSTVLFQMESEAKCVTLSEVYHSVATKQTNVGATS